MSSLNGPFGEPVASPSRFVRSMAHFRRFLPHFPALSLFLMRFYSIIGVTHPVPELEYTLEDSRSQIVICHDQYLEKIEPLVRKLAIKLIKLSEIDFSTAGLSQAPAYDIDPSRRAMILYTRYAT